jgi:hypothetical protein
MRVLFESEHRRVSLEKTHKSVYISSVSWGATCVRICTDRPCSRIVGHNLHIVFEPKLPAHFHKQPSARDGHKLPRVSGATTANYAMTMELTRCCNNTVRRSQLMCVQFLSLGTYCDSIFSVSAPRPIA